MCLRRHFYLLALLFLFGIPRHLHAADWPAINPAELQMKELPDDPGASACMLFREEIDDDTRHMQSHYYRIKILNETGRKYGDVQLPYYEYSGITTSITDVAGRTIHSDGTVINYQNKPYDKVIVKSKAVKERVKVFSLPDVQVGSIVELRFNVRFDAEWLMPPHWDVQEDIFIRREHFRFIPSSYERVGWIWKLPNGVKINSGQWRYDLDLSDVPAFVEEEHMPSSSYLFMYYVRFYYGQESDPNKFWDEIGKYWRDLVESFMNKKRDLADAVAKVTSPGDSQEQKAKKIYAYIQSLDNSSFKPERSEKEVKQLGIKDRNVADILRQGGGDQEDLTLLFVAMARAAGIPAYPMWITNRKRAIFQKNLTDLHQLDAEVAVLTLDGKEVFLDPGTKYCPYGLLYWTHTYTGGLKETAKGAELAQTPMPLYTDATLKRAARLKMDETGVLTGSIAVGWFGQEALSLRIEGSRTDDVGRTKILEDEVRQWLPSNATLTLASPPKWNDGETPLIAEFSVSTPMLVSAGKRALLPTNIFQFGRPAMFAHKERRYPVNLEYPSRESDDIRIKLPDNVQVENLPPSENNRVEFALYKVERTQENNELIIKRDFAINNFFFPPSDYNTLKGFYDKMKESDEQQAMLKQVASVGQK